MNKILVKYCKIIPLLCVMIFLNYTGYLIADIVLKNCSESYRKLPNSNRRYVVKNLTKSFVLFLLLLLGIPVFYNIIFYDAWDNDIIYIIGTAYTSTDLTGLLFVSDLPKETKIHHTCVLIIGTINILMDYTENGLHRGFIYLTSFSMIPYLVNTYLGLRYLETNEVKKKIIFTCLLTYTISVLINFGLQHLYVFWLISDTSPKTIAKKIGYLSIYYFILYDDIKLLKYLKFKYLEN